ncbi:MAG: hypothetical protein IPI32_01015 [Austwickia sp.]|nr:hypothetical protein [Austwickia sp.]MBK9102807.1 hypothetical protein [Austwickia sp.]
MEPFARQLRRRLETIHAVTYFAPESLAAAQDLGVRGFWRMYFGFRAAPLGRCTAPVVTAAFSGFAPSMVTRAVPQIWELAEPAAYLRARERAVAAALERLGGSALRTIPDWVLETLTAAAAAASPAGRPLYAANRELPLPPDPTSRVWQLATTLREHRGDGHVALWVTLGLTPIEVAVLFVATAGTTRASLQTNRGWSDPEWERGRASLAARGLLDATGATVRGRELRAAVEADTDRLADAPFDGLSAQDRERLVTALDPLAAAITRAGAIPYPNPMGLHPARC